MKHDWIKELGSEVAGGGKDSQQTQPKNKNPIVRTGRLGKSEQPFGSLAQEIDKGDLFGCESKKSQLNQLNPNPDHDRTGQPVVGSDPRTAQGARKTSRSQEIETRSFH